MAALPMWLADGREVLPAQIRDDLTYRAIMTPLVAEGGLGWDGAAEIVTIRQSLGATCGELVWDYLGDRMPSAGEFATAASGSAA